MNYPGSLVFPQLHSKYDHDCSKCDPPSGFPTSTIPPRELDPAEGPIDGQKMWTFFSNKFTSQITRIVNFAKMIPGFKQLDREDQITLIKTGLFEVKTEKLIIINATFPVKSNYFGNIAAQPVKINDSHYIAVVFKS